MKSVFNSKGIFALLLVALVVISGFLAYKVFSLTPASPTLAVGTPIATLPTPTSTLPPVFKTTVPTPEAGSCNPKQRVFEMGITFPRWSNNGYGQGDQGWISGLPDMHNQTSACWVEMPLLFSQVSQTSTQVIPGGSTPSLTTLSSGIQYAHSVGLHVFLVPIIDTKATDSWSGRIHFANQTEEAEWFASYWQMLKPYAQLAQKTGVEQMAVGTEEEWLQLNAPAEDWNNLIDNMHSVFQGSLTYDMNWGDVSNPVPTWMHNPNLKMIGVSAYFQVVNKSEFVEPAQIPALWASTVQVKLDGFAQKLGESIFISEIGYRDTSDALFQPYSTKSSAPASPEEQAGACAGALKNVINDPNILGIYFWAWSGAGLLNLADTQAATVIHSYYSSWKA
jgi:hypothetical protein